jgi:RecG-like helicase
MRLTKADTMKKLFLLILITLVVSAASSASADKITPAQAKDHIGKHATVCGVVASANFAARSSRQPTFLNLDKPYPDHIFTAVIWIEDRPKFGKPETLKGKRVCVSGLVEDYRGKPQIVLQEADQLRPE